MAKCALACLPCVAIFSLLSPLAVEIAFASAPDTWTPPLLPSICLLQHKYTLLEEADIDFVRKHTLEAKVEIDRDGTGACVYAVVKSKTDASVS